MKKNKGIFLSYLIILIVAMVGGVILYEKGKQDGSVVPPVIDKKEEVKVDDKKEVVVKKVPPVNLPPVITSVDGPRILTDRSGTWTVNAYDPEGGKLEYAVAWGDLVMVTNCDPIPVGVVPGPCPQPTLDKKMHTAFTMNPVFTHTYSAPGKWTPVFIAKDDKGNQTEYSVTVEVDNNFNTSVLNISNPVGGEKWGIRVAHVIGWNFVNGASVNQKVDIYLGKQRPVPECNPRNCGPMVLLTPSYEWASYILDTNVSNTIPYSWLAGTDTNDKPIPEGTYVVQICPAGSVYGCVQSKAFLLVKDENGITSYNQYSNPSYGFSFSYPSTWKLTEDTTKKQVTITSDTLSSVRGENGYTIPLEEITFKATDKSFFNPHVGTKYGEIAYSEISMILSDVSSNPPRCLPATGLLGVTNAPRGTYYGGSMMSDPAHREQAIITKNGTIVVVTESTEEPSAVMLNTNLGEKITQIAKSFTLLGGNMVANTVCTGASR